MAPDEMKMETLHNARRPQGRAAFTLVELLVVIGLMALLGTISVGGYFAAVRGMADRGAKQDAVSLVRLAMQTALIDQKPTAVLFYNRPLGAGDDKDEKVVGSSGFVGMAVAIKMAGRITLIEDNTLVDEFADWNQSYPTSNEDSSDVAMRLYRMTDLNLVAGGIDKCSSLVYPWVSPVHANLDEEWMAASGAKVNWWTSNFRKNATQNQAFSGTAYANGNNMRWGFKIKEQLSAQWKVGDAYGVEIASLQLPKEYIFGDKAPSSTRIDPVRSLAFNPADITSLTRYDFPLNNTVKISAYRGGLAEVGTIDASDLKDD